MARSRHDAAVGFPRHGAADGGSRGADGGYVGVGGGPWDDETTAGLAPVDHRVTTVALGYDVETETRFTDLEFGILASNTSVVDLTYETPRGLSSTFTKAVSSQSGLLYDTGLQYDSGLQYNTSTTNDSRVRAGVNALGRWIKATISHSVLGEQFGVQIARVRGYQTGSESTAP
jgi:hypothetical protein